MEARGVRGRRRVPPLGRRQRELGREIGDALGEGARPGGGISGIDIGRWRGDGRIRYGLLLLPDAAELCVGVGPGALVLEMLDGAAGSVVAGGALGGEEGGA